MFYGQNYKSCINCNELILNCLTWNNTVPPGDGVLIVECLTCNTGFINQNNSCLECMSLKCKTYLNISNNNCNCL